MSEKLNIRALELLNHLKLDVASLNEVLAVSGLRVVEEKAFEQGDYLFSLHEYASYEEYKEIQVKFNKHKIDNVWADEATLDLIGKEIQRLNVDGPIYGICHGSRNGFEQRYFNENFSNFHCIGTDISDTATSFENSVEWDFHDYKEEWVSKFDFVYSNSHDQSWNPKQAICTWLNQIKRNTGRVVLEHTLQHGPLGAGAMDPFGVHPLALPYFFIEWFGDQISLSITETIKSNNNMRCWLFQLTKLVDQVILRED